MPRQKKRKKSLVNPGMKMMTTMMMKVTLMMTVMMMMIVMMTVIVMTGEEKNDF
jgi:hypothetical protein